MLMTRAQGDWLEFLVTRPDTSISSDFSNFSGLTVPVLIMWGESDDVTPLWQGKALQQLIPGSELQVIPGVGHIPYLEDRATFNRLLVEFLHKHR